MCCTQVQLGSSIAAVNRYLTRKSNPSDYYIRRLRKETAEKTFSLLSYSQKTMLSKLVKDLNSSLEYSWNDILIYAAIRWYNLDKIWQFDNPDQYVMIKENLKKVSKIFDKKQYITDINMLLEKIETSKVKMEDLFKVQSDGTSLIYKLYNEGLVSLKIVSEFSDVIGSSTNELDEHKRFKKFANIIKQIEQKN